MTATAWQPRALPPLSGTLAYMPEEEDPAGPSSTEILSRWKAAGQAWLEDLSRLHLRSVLGKMAEKPSPGQPSLYQVPKLLGDVVAVAGNKLAPARAATALRGAIFQVWPVPRPLLEPLGLWVALGWEGRLPRWYQEDYQSFPSQLWSFLETELKRATKLLEPREVEGSLRSLGVPASVWKGDWSARVVEAGIRRLVEGIGSSRSVGLLLRLCDRNGIKEASTPISSLHQQVTRAAINWARQQPSVERAAVAGLVVERMGLPAEYPERWLGLEEEKAVLRGWLLEGFMADLWGPLSGVTLKRPVGGRQDLWALYPTAVTEVNLILSPEMKEKLEQGPAAKVLASVRGLVTVSERAGLAKEGCALWVVLQEGRRAATVLEWGGMARYHLRTGGHAPNLKQSGAQSLTWAGWEDSLSPSEGWEGKLTEKLRLYGIHAEEGGVPLVLRPVVKAKAEVRA